MLRQFKNDIYPRVLWVGTEDAIPAVLAAFSPMDNTVEWTESAFEDKIYATVPVFHKSTRLRGYFVLVRQDDLPAWRHAAHEATHCAILTCGDLGIGASTDEQEAMAYLVGYYTQCIMEVAETLKDGEGRG